MFSLRHNVNRILLCIVIFNLSACSFFVGENGIFRDRKKDYRQAEALPRIEIPEHLDSQAIVDFYPVPPVSPFSDGEMIDEFPLPVGVVNTEAAVKIQTMDTSQWVLLQASASQVWPRLKEFLSNQGLTLSVENSATGMMEARSGEGIYRFRIEQGFQRNTSEVSARFLNESSSGVFWPDTSSDASREQEMINQLAAFFANVSDKPSYSFAAQGISTQKKIDIEHDAEGGKILVLMVGELRAWLTLKQGFSKAGFTIKKTDVENKLFVVQYTPPLPADEQPGVVARFFGIKPDPYDEEEKYAGRHYHLQLKGDDDQSRILIQALDIEAQTESDLRKEQNYILLLLKERLY